MTNTIVRNPYTGLPDVTGSGGSSSSGNAITGTVDFGFASGQEGDVATVTIAAPWITGATVLIAGGGIATADHDIDDYAAEGIQFYPSNLVVGVGFDITATAPNGTWGRYTVNVIGV